MTFEYSSLIAASSEGDYFVLRRPEIQVVIRGPKGHEKLFGLVDTGADETIFPRSVADYLEIPVRPKVGASVVGFGGQELSLVTGEAVLEVSEEDESVTWKTDVSFFQFPPDVEQSVILGHAGFLEFFTAVFDGKCSCLTLEANDDLPIEVVET